MEAAVSKMNTKDIAYIAIFTALIAVCSWMSLPMPSGIPVTLQTLGLFLAVGVLGGRRGTAAVAAYLLLGMIGAPVLAEFHGGLGAYLAPSGGYLVGFLFTALLMWAMERLLGKKLWVLGVSMVLGMLVYYVFGTAWFMIAYAKSEGAVELMTVLGWCVFPFLVPDCMKLGLALIMSKELRRYVR